MQVPTSLLAQVDSSVGGKTGVNHPGGKNLIGAFYQPRLVVADLRTLETLDAREVRSGLVEVVKYGLIWDASFFSYLEENFPRILDLQEEALRKIVRTSCEVKAAVVGRDEKEEKGIRTLLNLGHTFGHALEAATDYKRYTHGEGGGRRNALCGVDIGCPGHAAGSPVRPYPVAFRGDRSEHPRFRGGDGKGVGGHETGQEIHPRP